MPEAAHMIAEPALHRPPPMGEAPFSTPDLRVLLETISDHFVQYDEHWRFAFVTEKGAALLGKSRADLLGKTLWDAVPGVAGTGFEDALRRARREQRLIRFENYFAPLDRWFDNHIYPMPTGVAVFSADITERKNAQLALQSEESQRKALLELIPTGVYFVSAPDGEIRYFNKRAAELWGREPRIGEERICGSWKIFALDGTPIPHERCPMVDVLAGRQVRNAEMVVERPDGSRITCLVNADPVLGADGSVIGAVNVFQDISERKASELALQQSRKSLQDFVENAAEGLHWVDENGIVIWANQAELDMLGYTREEYIGRPITDFHAERPAIEDILCRLKNREVLRDYEALLRCKDGSSKPVSINSSVLFDGDRFVHTCCFTRDISARKQMEEARANLAAIVESSHDAIMSRSLDGVTTSWNRAAERLLGYPAAEMIGRSFWTVVPPERMDEEHAVLDQLRRGGAVDHYETLRRHRDGHLIDVAVTVSPVRDAAGRVVGASSVARDITERKRAEREIRDREERYRSLVEASGAIVFTCDAQVNWTEPVPEWEAYTGQTFDQYRGHGWAQAIHPDDLARVQASIAEAVSLGRVWHDEGRLWHAPSRTYRHNEARSVPIRGPDGKVRVWVGTCLDVHARKTAEQTVREADRRKDEFLAVLAHELRNPLAPICTGMQMLRMPAGELARSQVFDVMERQIQHLVRLVDDLMEVSRITRGAIELRKEPVALQDAMRAAIEISRGQLEAKQHALDVQIGESALMVHGDRVRLTQILANVLNNAAKFTPSKGHIAVGVELSGQHAIVRVKDSGVGMSPETLRRVFDMFFQGGSARANNGLGIGLSLAKRLVELHDGTIEARSDGEGAGSEFVVRLPLAEARTDAQPPARHLRPSSSARKRVLVVDDNQDAANLLADLLAQMGHEVRAVHSGRAALAAARELRPEIALLDLGMPDMDGYQLARALHAAPETASTRIVAISGWGQEADRKRAAQAGFDLHLVKPVELADLKNAMKD